MCGSGQNALGSEPENYKTYTNVQNYINYREIPELMTIGKVKVDDLLGLSQGMTKKDLAGYSPLVKEGIVKNNSINFSKITGYDEDLIKELYNKTLTTSVVQSVNLSINGFTLRQANKLLLETLDEYSELLGNSDELINRNKDKILNTWHKKIINAPENSAINVVKAAVIERNPELPVVKKAYKNLSLAGKPSIEDIYKRLERVSPQEEIGAAIREKERGDEIENDQRIRFYEAALELGPDLKDTNPEKYDELRIKHHPFYSAEKREQAIIFERNLNKLEGEEHLKDKFTTKYKMDLEKKLHLFSSPEEVGPGLYKKQENQQQSLKDNNLYKLSCKVVDKIMDNKSSLTDFDEQILKELYNETFKIDPSVKLTEDTLKIANNLFMHAVDNTKVTNINEENKDLIKAEWHKLIIESEGIEPEIRQKLANKDTSQDVSEDSKDRARDNFTPRVVNPDTIEELSEMSKNELKSVKNSKDPEGKYAAAIIEEARVEKVKPNKKFQKSNIVNKQDRKWAKGIDNKWRESNDLEAQAKSVWDKKVTKKASSDNAKNILDKDISNKTRGTIMKKKRSSGTSVSK